MTVARLGAPARMHAGSEPSIELGGWNQMTYTCSNHVARVSRIVGLALILSLGVFGSAVSALAAGTAQFTAPTPSSTAQLKVKPSWVSVTADDSAPITSATMRINGKTVPVSIDFPIGHFVYDEEQETDLWVADDRTVGKLMAYNIASRIVPGANSVEATVTSAAGSSSYSWSFTFGTATTISSVSPTSGALIPGSPEVVVVSLSSPQSSFSATMSVDGVVVPTTFSAAAKSFTFRPDTALAPGKHTVVFSAKDAIGGVVSRTFSFEIRPPMSLAGDCRECHAAFPAAHTVSGCEDCHSHGYTVAGGTHGNQTPTAVGCTGDGLQQATACHTLDHRNDSLWGSWGSGPFDCTDCHQAAYPAVPGHTESQVISIHATTAPTCTPCHSASLVAEHAKYPRAATIKYQCDLCHGPNVRQALKDAVATGSGACSTCHGDDPHPVVSHIGGTDAAVRAASLGSGTERGCSATIIGQDGCHDITNMGALHLDAPGSCMVCHGEGKTPSRECLTCHPTARSGGGSATETTLAAASYYHHNNRKYLVNSQDATPNPYYSPGDQPASGWYDSAYYNDCSDLCHVNIVTSAPAFAAYTGDRMWFSAPGGAGFYGPSERTLTSTTTVLPDGAYLDFKTTYRFNDSWSNGEGRVELTSDGGATWTTLTGTVGGNSKTVLTGDAASWLTAHYDLSAYSGQTVQVRFRFNDGMGFCIGWAVDDVEIGGSTGPVRTDGAESKTSTWISSYWIRSNEAYAPF